MSTPQSLCGIGRIVIRFMDLANLGRYENSDYATFVRTVHSSRFGDEVPVPHARTWFGEDGKPKIASSTAGRRQTAVQDDDSDDDVVVSRATATLKCPLTLQYFVVPYSSKVCKHTFEKSAIKEYFDMNGKYYDQMLGPRGRPIGPQGEKKAECPLAGCQKVCYTMKKVAQIPTEMSLDTSI